MALKPKGPERLILDFGDVHVLHEYLKTTPYHAVLTSLLPDQGDTLLALVYYQILASGARRYAGSWYEGSYARLLLPRAALGSQRISEFLSVLGDEALQRRFFCTYLAKQFPAEAANGSQQKNHHETEDPRAEGNGSVENRNHSTIHRRQRDSPVLADCGQIL
jgi:hypothetical protein